MLKNTSILRLLILLLLINTSKAQIPSQPVNIQSPNAATLGLFGEYKVSYFTGVPQIGVPLYTVQEKDLSMPIALSYHASGVRPDMHPGWVGLNWSLSAGGAISRIVHGKKPDDFNNPNTDFGYGGNSGYYFNRGVLNVTNWNNVDYMRSVEEQNLAPTGGQQLKNLDTEPDEFDFNFLNYSGKFYLGADGVWKVQCDKQVKVIFNNQFLPVPFTSIDQNGYYPTFSGFTIVAEDGTQFVFGGNTNAIEYSVPFFNQHDQWTANTWYLTQIISKNKVQVASFTYEPDDYISQMYIAINASLSTSTISSNPNPLFQVTCSSGGSGYAGQYSHSYLGMLVRPVYLKSIQTANYNINFQRSTSTELRYDQSIYDYNFGILSYSSGPYQQAPLPWLQVNREYPQGADLGIAYPACLAKLQWKELNQIQIQFKDGTPLRTFNLTYNNNQFERLMLNSVTETGSDNTTKPPYMFSYIQPQSIDQSLPPYLVAKSDHWGFYNGNYATLTLPDPNAYFNYRESNASYMQVGTLNKIIYPTGGVTDFVFEANDYSKQVKLIRSDGFNDLGVTKITGGLRIRKISSYDPTLSNPIVTKEYFYVNGYLPGSNSQTSSGVLGGQIQYYFNDYRVTAVNDPTVTYSTSLFSSQSVLPACINSQGSHIGYSEVTEKLGDGSYNKFYFSNFDNGYLDEATVTIQPSRTAYEPFTSNETERGKLLKMEAYNVNNIVVKKSEYNYVPVNKTTEFVKGLAGRFFYVCPNSTVWVDEGTAYINYTYSYLLSRNIETSFDLNGLNPVATTTNYYYDNPSHRQLTRTEFTDSKNNVQTSINRYPFEMVSLGQTTPYQEMVNRNIVSPVIQKEQQMNGTKQFENLALFAQDATSNLILPSAIQTQFKDNDAENRTQFIGYDLNGNLLSYANEKNAKTSYIWSYNGQYPVAKVENADYSNIQDVLGGKDAITAFATSMPTSAALASFLAPLRTDARMKNAQITTLTYSPGIGLINEIAPNGNSKTYEYDTFQRLMNVKDQYGNIVNHYDYHFGVQSPNTTFYSVSKSGVFYGNCLPAGNYAQSLPVMYTVPAGKYTSTSSQAAADQQAQQEVDNNGQAYANSTHNCY